MDNATQYIVDNSGHKISVIVPFEIWEQLNNDFSQLQKKLEVFKAVKDGLVEVQKNKKNLQTLSEFLNESNN